MREPTTQAVESDDEVVEQETTRKKNRLFGGDGSDGAGAAVGVLVASLWFLGCVSAVIMSIVCTARSNQLNIGQALVGVLVAFLFGPLWWIYYLYAGPSGYCKTQTTTTTHVGTVPMSGA